MTTQTTTAPGTTIRLLHGSFITGIILFFLIIELLIKRVGGERAFPPELTPVLIGVSFAASALSALWLRTRIPRRNTDESADLFWTNATQPAMIAWAPFEGAALAGLMAYMATFSPLALGAAAVGLLGLIVLNPWFLERR
jgi:hypothetical protein